jgi:arginine decarboxylase
LPWRWLLPRLWRGGGPGAAAYRVDPVTAPPPRHAFFAESDTVPIDQAVGQIGAEPVAPYPPGLPVLGPGEKITPATLAALDQAHAAGVRIAYAADPSLATLRVPRN